MRVDWANVEGRGVPATALLRGSPIRRHFGGDDNTSERSEERLPYSAGLASGGGGVAGGGAAAAVALAAAARFSTMTTATIEPS